VSLHETFVQTHDLIAEHGDVVGVVRDEHHRNIQTALKVGKFLPHALAQGHIER